MEKLMENETLWHLHEHIFGYLNHDTVEICRKVCKSWNESELLEIISHKKLVKLIQEFGDIDIVYQFNFKVSTFILGWKEAVEKYGAQATIEDLQEVRDSITKLVLENGKCCSWPVHEAAKIGAVKSMEVILNTSYDLNTRDDIGRTALDCAYDNGRTEIIQFLITSYHPKTLALT